MKVSIDFDGTLTRDSVQKYATELILSNVDVQITTSRNSLSDNSDLFAIADSIGLDRDNVIFTNKRDKACYLNSEFAFHLDDCFIEIRIINRIGKTKGVCVFGNKKWRNQCNELLEAEKDI